MKKINKPAEVSPPVGSTDAGYIHLNYYRYAREKPMLQNFLLQKKILIRYIQKI